MSPKKLISKILQALSDRLFYYCHKNNFQMASRPRIEGTWPSITNKGSLTFGDAVFFRSKRTRLNITVLKDAKINIASHSFFNDGVNICAAKEITIGENSKIGDMVYIYDTDFHQISPNEETRISPVHIGKNVWIGSHSKILPGITIGDHAVIAAGSIVTKNVPARTLVAGCPAKVVREFEAPDDWVRP